MNVAHSPRPVRLSKSKVVAGLQCPKRLWLQVYRRDDAEQGNTFALAVGHDVGAAAQRAYPQGILAGSHEDVRGSLARTAELLARPGPAVLFEAAFQADDVLVFADIVEKRDDGIHLIEVKSSTSVKDYHRDDVAVQAWVMRRAGFTPASVTVRVIDNRFVYAGDGNYTGLFRDTDLTREVRLRDAEITYWVADQRHLLAGDEPRMPMGDQCHAPYDCEFIGYCTRQCGRPETAHPLRILPRGGSLAAALEREGYTDLRDVPAAKLNGHVVFLRMRDAAISGEARLDPTAAAELARTEFPRYYLDFEGCQPAVPRWAGTRPYQSQPFQWSLHVEQEDGSLTHHDYLHTGDGEPMRPAMEALLAAIGTRGTVFVYNRAYEGGVLQAMAERFPDLAPRLLAIPSRFVDLLAIARRHYYHPDMKGSWSIKSVLPTISAEPGYASLGDVQEGGAAAQAFLEIIAPETTPSRRAQLVADLRRYCALDTLAMTKVVAHFAGGPGKR